MRDHIRSESLRVIKSFPFFNSKELAELGISESNGLVVFVGKRSRELYRHYLPHMHTSFA